MYTASSYREQQPNLLHFTVFSTYCIISTYVYTAISYREQPNLLHFTLFSTYLHMYILPAATGSSNQTYYILLYSAHIYICTCTVYTASSYREQQPNLLHFTLFSTYLHMYTASSYRSSSQTYYILLYSAHIYIYNVCKSFLKKEAVSQDYEYFFFIIIILSFK